MYNAARLFSEKNLFTQFGGSKMTEARIIKRYQNRKLYDTHQSCYVTLEEIAQIIREGHEIQVIDNKTKNDITYITQIQLLFDQEKKSTRAGDVELLKRVIRGNEGTFTGYIRQLEGIEAPQEEVTTPVATEAFKPFSATTEVNSTSTFENTTLN